MNTTNTPGPWQQGDGYNAHTTTVHIKSTLIAKAETEADARLIATAPELLAACQAALLRDDVADSDLGDMLRLVIAKATGVK